MLKLGNTSRKQAFKVFNEIHSVSDVVDVQLCVNVVLDLESDPGIVDRADVNEDGQWNAQDLQEMVNRVLED